jgi:hypothetical protein
MYNVTVIRRVLVCLGGALLLAGCSSREVEKDLKITDVHTGWYDAGIVEGNKNKLVPSISLKLENVSPEEIDGVQINAIFRRAGENEMWGDHLVRAIGNDGLAAGKTGGNLVLRSKLGYTGTETRGEMLANTQFVDAKVEIFGKHGRRNWVKMGEFPIERKLLAAAAPTVTPLPQ